MNQVLLPVQMVFFYCENSGHKSLYIPSNRVNDGICDCCDASDEYASGKQCPNNCNELGKEARLEQQKAEELVKEGNKIRIEMIAKGKQMKTEYHLHLDKLRVDYEEAELIKKEKEVLKKYAEEKESAVLELYKPAKTEQPAAEQEEGEESQESEAENYFKLLDSDSSGTVTIAELQTRAMFDIDHDGAVSETEALYFLNNQQEITLEEFVESAWSGVKPFLMKQQGMFKPDDQKEETQETFEEPLNENKEDDEAEEDDEVEEEEAGAEDQEAMPEEPRIQYDEETQALIDEATSARERFQEAEKAVNELQTEIRKLEEKLDRDYGPEQAFTSLDGECFEYTDLEYVYTLCMFGRATQRSKNGGSDINLGHWHDWAGPEGHKYSKMKFDRGLTCWNGPARSTLVSLTCGRENKLMSVTEPSRCEYAMEFSTPALCNPGMQSGDTHDEL